MDRFLAMLILLGVLVSLVLIVMALFAVAPIISFCLVCLLYPLYLFIANEEAGAQYAQEIENRFWTMFAIIFSGSLFFARDSPLAFVGAFSPRLALLFSALSGYAMHLWDRHRHRIAISQTSKSRYLRRQRSSTSRSSLLRLEDLGIEVAAHLDQINECLAQIDQLLIPSTINNLLNLRYVQSKERKIIKIIEECDARALNYLISNVKLGLLFYKIKDHRSFNGKNRTDLINLLAVERLPILTVVSRVILLHSLQLLKLRSNARAEFWVQNILLNTHRDDLSELKTLTDAKGDYFSMTKLIYDDIRSESIRQIILFHFRREAAVQETYKQMGAGPQRRLISQMRKVLSDVDDTLVCSGGMYPAGVDKQYPRKTVYPGVLAFYRELDSGTEGPEVWEDDQVGNLVFLSARPHVYRDLSEKHSIAKFERLQADTLDGRKGMHTTPGLLSGDLQSGRQYVMTNDFEPLARKKLDNFSRYVSIYPEYKHVFVCDNGQGDVRAAELMFDQYPYEFEAVYVHSVIPRNKTYGYAPERWRQNEFMPFFFRSYPEAALHAATQHPPLIRVEGLRRICVDAVKDFLQIKPSQFSSHRAREDRRLELNQSIWRTNKYLINNSLDPVEFAPAEQRWDIGDKVSTVYGSAIVVSFDATYNLYKVILDWSSLAEQVRDYTKERSMAKSRQRPSLQQKVANQQLETVNEIDDEKVNEETDSSASESQMASSENLKTDHSATPTQSVSAHATPNSRASNVDTHEDGVRSPISQEVGESSSESSDANRRPNTCDTLSQKIKETVHIERQGRFFATVAGCSIRPFVAPSLPALSKTKSSYLFQSLLSMDSKSSATKTSWSEGDSITTPYGPALVIEHKEKQCIVVARFIGWHAKAYLHETSVKRPSKSVIGTFLRQLSGVDSQKPMPTEAKFSVGTSIATPFGPAKVEKATKVLTSSNEPGTVGLRLVSWKLADGSSPMIYCTFATAQAWKESKNTPNLLTTLNNIVASYGNTLFEPFLSQRKPASGFSKRFIRYFVDSASVRSKYGVGRVQSFREEDGVYEIRLSNWKLADGSLAVLYARQDDLSCYTVDECREGFPVLTSLGLTGTLASVEPTTGIHIVTIRAMGTNMVCYLQPEAIIRPLLGSVGDDVVTQYGEGILVSYDNQSQVYEVRLSWGARLYTTSLDRVGDGTQMRDGSYGVDWIFNLFFRKEAAVGVRSRSNSIVSSKSGQHA